MRELLVYCIFGVLNYFVIGANIPLQKRLVNNNLYEKYLCVSKPNGFKAIVPGSCSQYYECQNGFSILNKCPKYFDSKGGICVDANQGCVENFDVNIDTFGSCTGPCCGKTVGYIVSKNNPRIYYNCLNHNVISTGSCSNELEFNLATLKCDIPSQCVGNYPCTTTTCSTLQEKTTQSTYSYGISSSTNTVNERTTTTCQALPVTTTTCKSESSTSETGTPHSETSGPMTYETSTSIMGSTLTTTFESTGTQNSGVVTTPTPLLTSTTNREYTTLPGYETSTNTVNERTTTTCQAMPVTTTTCKSESSTSGTGTPHSETSGPMTYETPTSFIGTTLTTIFESPSTQTSGVFTTPITLLTSTTNREYTTSPGSETSTNTVNERTTTTCQALPITTTTCKSESSTSGTGTPSTQTSGVVTTPTPPLTSTTNREYTTLPGSETSTNTVNERTTTTCQAIPVTTTTCKSESNTSGTETPHSETTSSTTYQTSTTIINYTTSTFNELSTSTTCNSVTTTPCITYTPTPFTETAQANAIAYLQNINNNVDLYTRYACRAKENGFQFASLKSCNEYFICLNQQSVPVSCGNKYYNAIKRICDAPENTVCFARSK